MNRFVLLYCCTALGIVQSLAAELDQAQKTRVQLRQFSLRIPTMTIEDCYAIQTEWVKLKLARRFAL